MNKRPAIFLDNVAPTINRPYAFSVECDGQVFITSGGAFAAKLYMLKTQTPSNEPDIDDYFDMKEGGSSIDFSADQTQQKDLGVGSYAIVFSSAASTVTMGLYK